MIYILPVIAYMVLILYLSVHFPRKEPPPEEPPPVNDTSGFEPAETEPAEAMLYVKYNVPLSDIMANIALYSGFGFLMQRTMHHYYPLHARKKGSLQSSEELRLGILLTVLLCGTVFSAFNETLQMNVASRVSDIFDVIYNIIGTIMGAVSFILIVSIKRKKESKTDK